MGCSPPHLWGTAHDHAVPRQCLVIRSPGMRVLHIRPVGVRAGPLDGEWTDEGTADAWLVHWIWPAMGGHCGWHRGGGGDADRLGRRAGRGGAALGRGEAARWSH